jgi:hypothetical protein
MMVTWSSDDVVARGAFEEDQLLKVIQELLFGVSCLWSVAPA